MIVRTLLNRSGLIAAAFACMFLSHANAQEGSPIKIGAELSQSANAEGEFVLTIDMAIKSGWHTYDVVPPGNPSPSTQVTLDVPDGVSELGEWDRPASFRYENEGLTVFTDDVKFSRNLKIKPSEKDREIGVSVKYQVCTAKMCQPPKTFKTKVVLAGVKSVKPSGPPEFKNEFFSAPEMLHVGDKPLNQDARQMYPSPAMYDVDGDGVVELVVGDIFGSLNVYENKNAGGSSQSADPVWEKFRPLLAADGDKIKVSNW